MAMCAEHTHTAQELVGLSHYTDIHNMEFDMNQMK